MNNKNNFIKKNHLIISVIIVIPVALIYGFKTNLLFDIDLNTVDEHNFFKAIMGLYLGFSSLWVLGIFKPAYWKLAIISNIIFMLGLGLGRIISMCLDGFPTFIYLFGAFAELFLGLYGVWVFMRYKSLK